MPERYRFFRYRRETDRGRRVAAFFRRALRTAAKYVDRVHAVVLPELALTWDEYLALERAALSEHVLLIAGVEHHPSGRRRSPQNAAIVQPVGLFEAEDDVLELLAPVLRCVQPKNHRWRLDGPQIRRYGLSGRLPASRNCWELSELSPRRLAFHSLGTWLTFCVLVCEDFARQDAISGIIRSVGPNLVVALLMDGPQVRSRWPARYASILAEDPGCSVLTLTSLGMNRLSRPDAGTAPRGDVIGLWRDIRNGERELEFQRGENACILSLVYETQEEYSADGRGDGGVSHFPVLADVHGLSVELEGAIRRSDRLVSRSVKQP